MWRVPRRWADSSSRPARNLRMPTFAQAVFSRAHHDDDVPVAGRRIRLYPVIFDAPARPHNFAPVERASSPVGKFEAGTFNELHGRNRALTSTARRGGLANMLLRLWTSQVSGSQIGSTRQDAEDLGKELLTRAWYQLNCLEFHFTYMWSRPRKSNPSCLMHPRNQTGTVHRLRGSRSYSTWTMRSKGASKRRE